MCAGDPCVLPSGPGDPYGGGRGAPAALVHRGGQLSRRRAPVTRRGDDGPDARPLRSRRGSHADDGVRSGADSSPGAVGKRAVAVFRGARLSPRRPDGPAARHRDIVAVWYVRAFARHSDLYVSGVRRSRRRWRSEHDRARSRLRRCERPLSQARHLRRRPDGVSLEAAVHGHDGRRNVLGQTRRLSLFNNAGSILKSIFRCSTTPVKNRSPFAFLAV